jgi:predicted amidohydrolase
MIINPRGEIISSANDTETVLTAEISTTDLFKQRKKFPVHLDADEFTFTS